MIGSSKYHVAAGKLYTDNPGIWSKTHEDPFITAKANLRLAQKILADVIKVPGHKDILAGKSESILEFLDDIYQTGESELVDLSAECRVILQKFLKS